MRQRIPFYLIDMTASASLSNPLAEDEVRPLVSYLVEIGWHYKDINHLLAKTKACKHLSKWNKGCKNCGKPLPVDRTHYCSKVCGNTFYRLRKTDQITIAEELRLHAKDVVSHYKYHVDLAQSFFEQGGEACEPDWSRILDGDHYVLSPELLAAIG